MKKLASLLVVAVAAITFAAVTVAQDSDVRTWTDSTGQYSLEATFVKFESGKVYLKRKDGSTVSLLSSKLSRNDQQFVRDLLRTKRTSLIAKVNRDQQTAKGDWPQWRGPKQDGISPEKGLLDKWPNNGPPLLWSAGELGGGFSSVSIANGKIYTMGKVGGGTALICRNVSDGSAVWHTPAGGGGAPNCTPTVDVSAKLALGLTHGGDLLCANSETGEKLWSKNFGRDFGGKMMSGWGYSESPLIDGDRVIVTPGGDRAVMVALDKKTGKTIWSAPLDGNGGAGYATPVISNGGGVKQYITLVRNGLIGVDAETGKVLWNYKRIGNGTANIPTSIVKGDYVLCSTGYGTGTALLQLQRSSRGVNYREVWFKGGNELQNHHGGMMLIGDHVFMGEGHNKGLPVCFEFKTGQVKWGPVRGLGTGSAAIMAADGDLYFRYQNGVMALIEATPNGYNPKGSFRIATVKRESWAHPVIADKKLYLRDQDQLHCYNIAAN